MRQLSSAGDIKLRWLSTTRKEKKKSEFSFNIYKQKEKIELRTSATGVLTEGQVRVLERDEALQRSGQLRAPGTARPRPLRSLSQDKHGASTLAWTENHPSRFIYSY